MKGILNKAKKCKNKNFLRKTAKIISISVVIIDMTLILYSYHSVHKFIFVFTSGLPCSDAIGSDRFSLASLGIHPLGAHLPFRGVRSHLFRRT